jgi:hypothetical protein
LAGEGAEVAEDSEGEAVGDEAPEVGVGAVEEILKEAVRGGAGGSGDA